jgi:hypothetical protein
MRSFGREPDRRECVISANDARALELYRMALSLLEAKGRFVSVGLSAYQEYRGEHLSIIYLPQSSHLDVWHRRKVLTITRRAGSLRVIRYNRGEWEEELQQAAPSARKSA